jgi:hypothetical protein
VAKRQTGADAQEGSADEKETLEWLLAKSKRRSGVAIRHGFVHVPTQGGGPGPLKAFMRREGALDLYMLVLLIAGRGTHTVELPLAVWSRALGRGDDEAAEVWVSKTLTFIAKQGLLTSRRSGRLRQLTVLDDAGRKISYEPPTGTGGPYEWFLRVPLEYWQQGWHKELTLAAKATLLTCLTRRPEFEMPLRRSSVWFGLSRDTLSAGLHELQDLGLLSMRKVSVKAPGLRHGYTITHRYALTGPFKRSRGKATGQEAADSSPRSRSISSTAASASS